MSNKTAYIDSSVLLRNLLGESEQIRELDRFKNYYSSRLLKTECIRVLNRAFSSNRLNDIQYSEAYQRLLFRLKGIKLIALDENIFDLAESHLPVALGTLDALHLSTAIRIRDVGNISELKILTHDNQLGKACRAVGFSTLGC